MRCHSFQHLQNALAYAKMLPATCSNIRKPHLHMPTCYTFQHPQTALAHADMLHVPAFANRMFRVQGLGGEKDKDMVNVGVRRQTRSPPNIAMLSSIPRGSSQAKPQTPNTVTSLLGQCGSSQVRAAALLTVPVFVKAPLAKPQPLQCCLGFVSVPSQVVVVEIRSTSCKVVVTSCRVVDAIVTSCRVAVTSGHILFIRGCRI